MYPGKCLTLNLDQEKSLSSQRLVLASFKDNDVLAWCRTVLYIPNLRQNMGKTCHLSETPNHYSWFICDSASGTLPLVADEELWHHQPDSFLQGKYLTTSKGAFWTFLLPTICQPRILPPGTNLECWPVPQRCLWAQNKLPTLRSHWECTLKTCLSGAADLDTLFLFLRELGQQNPPEWGPFYVNRLTQIHGDWPLGGKGCWLLYTKEQKDHLIWSWMQPCLVIMLIFLCLVKKLKVRDIKQLHKLTQLLTQLGLEGTDE
jgi:hypothetical protein